MKLFSKNFGQKKDCIANLYEIINQIAGNSLVIEEQKVVIPDDAELAYKIKYSEEPGESKFSIKIEWPNEIPVPEAVEEMDKNEDEKEKE